MFDLIIENIHTISYWLNLLMFLPVPLILSMTMANMCVLTKFKPRFLILSAGAIGVLSILLFMIAQASWIVFGHSGGLPLWSVNVWLGFDFTNAAYYLLSSTGLYLQSVWIKNRMSFEKSKHIFFCQYGDTCDVKHLPNKNKNRPSGQERPTKHQVSLAKEIE